MLDKWWMFVGVPSPCTASKQGKTRKNTLKHHSPVICANNTVAHFRSPEAQLKKKLIRKGISGFGYEVFWTFKKGFLGVICGFMVI
jgi:hypothetical protein